MSANAASFNIINRTILLNKKYIKKNQDFSNSMFLYSREFLKLFLGLFFSKTYIPSSCDSYVKEFKENTQKNLPFSLSAFCLEIDKIIIIFPKLRRIGLFFTIKLNK